MTYKEKADPIIWEFERISRKRDWLHFSKDQPLLSLPILWPVALSLYARSNEKDHARLCMKVIKHFGDGMRWFPRRDMGSLSIDVLALVKAVEAFEHEIELLPTELEADDLRLMTEQFKLVVDSEATSVLG